MSTKSRKRARDSEEEQQSSSSSGSDSDDDVPLVQSPPPKKAKLDSTGKSVPRRGQDKESRPPASETKAPNTVAAEVTAVAPAAKPKRQIKSARMYPYLEKDEDGKEWFIEQVGSREVEYLVSSKMSPEMLERIRQCRSHPKRHRLRVSIDNPGNRTAGSTAGAGAGAGAGSGASAQPKAAKPDESGRDSDESDGEEESPESIEERAELVGEIMDSICKRKRDRRLAAKWFKALAIALSDTKDDDD